MAKNKQVIESEIAFWSDQSDFYNKYFRQNYVIGLVQLCAVATHNVPSFDKLIVDFVAGLALLPFYLKTKDVQQGAELEQLMKPVLDLLIERVKSDDYRQNLIDHELSGDEFFSVNGVTVPLTKDALLKHIGRTNSIPITTKDIAEIEKSLVEYKRHQFGNHDSDQSPRTEAPFISEESKTEKLREVLSPFGFFELPLVRVLKQDSQEKLLELISSQSLPYKIALIDYLGFIEHLKKNHYPIFYELSNKISSWFDSDKDGRSVRGNFYSLIPNSTENKKRYTAHIHKQIVQKDYEALK